MTLFLIILFTWYPVGCFWGYYMFKQDKENKWKYTYKSILKIGLFGYLIFPLGLFCFIENNFGSLYKTIDKFLNTEINK